MEQQQVPPIRHNNISGPKERLKTHAKVELTTALPWVSCRISAPKPISPLLGTSNTNRVCRTVRCSVVCGKAKHGGGTRAKRKEARGVKVRVGIVSIDRARQAADQ